MNEHHFPDFYAEGADERVAVLWDLSWPLPVFWTMPNCPVCGDPRVVYKDWRFHERPDSRTPWRCDVRLKCVACSHVPIFGIRVHKGMAENKPTGWIAWRTGQQLLAEAGFFKE